MKGDVRNEYENVWECIGEHLLKGVDFQIDLLEF